MTTVYLQNLFYVPIQSTNLTFSLRLYKRLIRSAHSINLSLLKACNKSDKTCLLYFGGEKNWGDLCRNITQIFVFFFSVRSLVKATICFSLRNMTDFIVYLEKRRLVVENQYLHDNSMASNGWRMKYSHINNEKPRWAIEL